VFGADVKPHLVHEAVRAELNALRAGTRGAKSRGLVSGGRSKPWRQKGTGRARAGSTRAPHWTGGGLAFPPTMRSFAVKVNRKALRAALRGALAAHAKEGSLALVDGSAWETPSTKSAVGMLESWGKPLPLVLVVADDEDSLAKSFRNLDRVVVVTPGELEVAAVVWARSLLVSQAALEGVEARAGNGKPQEKEASE
jgi:large subunit ribosomal protein L4